MKTIRTYTASVAVYIGLAVLLALGLFVSQAHALDMAAGASISGTVCTMDAIQCPDGSWSGRSGPKCEFKCRLATSTPPAKAETFAALPSRGGAPLTVRFSSTLAEPSRYLIDFGDGATSTYKMCAESYPEQCSTTHTYQKVGVYTATLIKDPCPVGAACFAASPIVGKAVITVVDKQGNDDKDKDNDGNHNEATSSSSIHADIKSHAWFHWFPEFFSHFRFWGFRK